MAVPVTSDAECQKNRFIFIQPQTTSTTLATIQAISPSSVNLGHISSALAEYVFIGEIIVRYASNNWTWISSSKLVGTKVLQASIQGGGGGTVVSSNVSLATTLLGATNQDQLNTTLVAQPKGHVIKDGITNLVQQPNLTFSDDFIVTNNLTNQSTDIELSEPILTTLNVVGGIALIDLDKDRVYAPYTAGQDFDIQVNQTGKKALKSASLPLFPNGFICTVNSAIINRGTSTIDATKQNDILFGTTGLSDMYAIITASAYTDPKLAAPVVTIGTITTTSITWNIVDIATNVDTEVRISADGVTYGSWASIGANATTHTITGLTVGQTRYLQARFIGNGTTTETSDPSTAVSGTTSANKAPTVSSVLMTCTPSDWQEGNVIATSYIYADADSNAEDLTSNGTKYKVNAYDSEALATADTVGSGGTLFVSGYTGGSPSPNDTLTAALDGKWLRSFIQPVAVGGTTTGVWTAGNVSDSAVTASGVGDIVWTNFRNATANGGTLNITAADGGAMSTTPIVTEGMIWQYEVGVVGDTATVVLGIDSSITLQPSFDQIDFLFYFINGTNSYIRTPQLSDTATGYGPETGDLIEMRVESGVLKLYYYRANVWNLAYTFPTYTATTRYIQCLSAGAGNKFINNVKQG